MTDFDLISFCEVILSVKNYPVIVQFGKKIIRSISHFVKISAQICMEGGARHVLAADENPLIDVVSNLIN